MGYLKNFFSLKKIKYKKISLFSFWKGETTFEKTSVLCRGSQLISSHIGKYARVGVNVSLCSTTVGNFSAIGKDSVLGPGQHPTNYLSLNSIFYKRGNWGFHDDWVREISFEESKPINVGGDVWIGRKVMVMNGVTIGDGAIVGACSVVTKDVPPYAIVAGVPAKVIKYRYSQNIIDKLIKIKWWNLSDEEITRRIGVFHKPDLTEDDINVAFGDLLK